MELPFAGLHQLCAPLLDRLERLPGPAARGAQHGVRHDRRRAPDRFLVGLAVLSLLAEVAEERPLVCVVDDAQWLDQASAQALAFVARRLLAERVGAGVRGARAERRRGARGLPELVVEGLADDDARRLLDSTIPAGWMSRSRERIVAETRGNPLALLELPRGTDAGGAGGRVRAARRAAAGEPHRGELRAATGVADAETRRFLLHRGRGAGRRHERCCGARPSGSGSRSRRGAGRGRRADRARARRAVPSSAGPLGGLPSVDRARPARGPPGAGRGDRPGRRSRPPGLASRPRGAGPRRGGGGRARALRRAGAGAEAGVAAAAAFLERATELTPDPAGEARGRSPRRRRSSTPARREAAPSCSRSPRSGRSTSFSGRSLERAARADRLRVHAQAATLPRCCSPRPGGSSRSTPRLARETYLEALGAAMFAGRLGDGDGVREAAEADARGTAATGAEARRSTSSSMVSRPASPTGYAAGVPPLRRALDAFAPRRTPRARTTCAGCGWRARRPAIAPDLWDDERWHDLRRARGRAGARRRRADRPAHRAAPTARASTSTQASSPPPTALIEEADAITRGDRTARSRYTSLVLAAWRGDEPRR